VTHQDERPICPRCGEEPMLVNELDLFECPHCHLQGQRIDSRGTLHLLDERGEGRFRERRSSPH